MKFTRGIWLMREGVIPHYALHVHDYEHDAFHVFELADGAEVHTTVPDTQGRPALVLHTRREKAQVTFHAEGDTRQWQTVLRNTDSVREVVGATAEIVGNDIHLKPEGGEQKVMAILLD